MRSRPDVVAEWDDSEVARRWLMLCPERRDKNGKSEVPSEFELNHICKHKTRLKVIRSRLSDISWWMRLVSQNMPVFSLQKSSTVPPPHPACRPPSPPIRERRDMAGVDTWLRLN